MNDYLIVIVRDFQQLNDGEVSEVVEFRVIASASAAEAKDAVREISERRPLYKAFTIKMS